MVRCTGLSLLLKINDNELGLIVTNMAIRFSSFQKHFIRMLKVKAIELFMI